jgi:nucleoid DNA-binding protein
LDITSFIRELILLNECVILRGIGGFETSYKNAVYRKDKKIITPPSKKIHFQPDWIKDNGVLENYLAKSLGINNELASEYIDNYVQEFHNKLRDSGKILLSGVGEFILGTNGRIEFREIEDTNYLADSFGLDILDIELDTGEKKEPAKTKLVPLVTEPRRLTGWYIAIGVLLLLISVTFIILISEGGNTGILNIKKRSSRSEDVIVFGGSDKKETDSLTRSIEEALDSKTTTRNALTLENIPSTNNKSKIATNNMNNGIVYYLIAGSFKNLRNAELLKDQLLRKGFSPEIQHTKNSQFRVIVGKFYEHKDATEELRRIRIQLDQNVWLLEENRD